MQLDSYLEIFTTMYGWAFANIIGAVVAGTGLVIVPFAVIIFQSWREAKEDGIYSGGVLSLLERAQLRLLIALFVMSVCFATTPLTSLRDLRYTPMPGVVEPAPQEGSLAGGTGSGFDDAMRDASDGSMSTTGDLSYVPAWWFSVMAISSGVNNAVRRGVASSTATDIRVIGDMAKTATIEDPKTLNAVQRFYSECFVPARSKYLAMNKDDLTPASQALLDPANKRFGPHDVDWPGSHVFRTEPGFYSAMRSYNPVGGFAIDFARDTDYYNPSSGAEPPPAGVVANPAWGRPTCEQWWSDGTNGVRAKMTDQASSLGKAMVAANPLNWFDSEQRVDSYARLGIAKAKPTFVDQDRVAGTSYDTTSGLLRLIGGAASTIGVGAGVLATNFVFTPLITALPMMQALVLMAIYMFLPLVVLLSGFSLRAMFYGAVAIFTVKLWAAMWFIAQWIDAHMIEAMYPGLQGNVFLQEFTHIAQGSPQGYKRMVLNILMMTMFIGLPLIWTAMMGWIGVRVGGQLTNFAKETEGGAKQAGKISSSAVRGGR